MVDNGRNHEFPLHSQMIRDIATMYRDFDWDGHIRGLNDTYGFTGKSELAPTVTGVQPAWFNGDIDAIRSQEWLLVISLNPKRTKPGYYGNRLTRESYIDFWRRHNTDCWSRNFFPPLARIGSQILGEGFTRDEEHLKRVATERMIFVEICPYASVQWDIKSETFQFLVANDIGFRIKREVRNILMQHGQPLAILVNGKPAIDDMENYYTQDLIWHQKLYESPGRLLGGMQKQLKHKEGLLRFGVRTIPIVGFGFLRNAKTHNADEEIELLATKATSFLEWIL